jgi:hypothetical protein
VISSEGIEREHMAQAAVVGAGMACPSVTGAGVDDEAGVVARAACDLQ